MDDLLLTAFLLVAAATLVTFVWCLTGHYIDRPTVDYDQPDGQALQRHAAGHCDHKKCPYCGIGEGGM